MASRILPRYPRPILGQEVEEAIHQALGAASVCWSETPQGVFDSTRCKQIGAELLDIVISYAQTYPKPGQPGYQRRMHSSTGGRRRRWRLVRG